MKISELIGHLQKCLDEQGDLPVRFYEQDADGHGVEVAGVIYLMDHDGKPDEAILCDDQTLDDYNNAV